MGVAAVCVHRTLNLLGRAVVSRKQPARDAREIDRGIRSSNPLAQHHLNAYASLNMPHTSPDAKHVLRVVAFRESLSVGRSAGYPRQKGQRDQQHGNGSLPPDCGSTPLGSFPDMAIQYVGTVGVSPRARTSSGGRPAEHRGQRRCGEREESAPEGGCHDVRVRFGVHAGHRVLCGAPLPRQVGDANSPHPRVGYVHPRRPRRRVHTRVPVHTPAALVPNPRVASHHSALNTAQPRAQWHRERHSSGPIPLPCTDALDECALGRIRPLLSGPPAMSGPLPFSSSQ